jgi:uncharacterized protein YhfF
MEKTLQTDAFWESNAPTTNGMSPNYSVRRIGGNVKTTNIILELIVGGHKTGTFGLKWLQDIKRQPAFSVGCYSVLVDINNFPNAIIQTTQIAIINYCDITEEHLLIEGPNARTLGVWKDIHWPYWSGLLEEASLAPSLTMPIVVETFALVSK